MKVLITGGAGFVGASLARLFVTTLPHAKVTAFDNLRRRGSELNVRSFSELGIRFIHGDIRNSSDLATCGSDFDLFIEASAEPSVHAGVQDDPDYVVQTNLFGTFNCLKFARNHAREFIFLSTSRVYSIAPLRAIALDEDATRFTIKSEQVLAGVSATGISEDFNTTLPRSFYGATKLCSEYLIQEFVAGYGLKARIYRCGVLAGPGQFGRVDQGVFTLWVVNHYFKKELRYTGFGGEGKQVRDLLHPSDLFELINSKDQGQNAVFNVGGGPAVSVSLRELTDLCQKVVGNKVRVTKDADTSPVDVPVYVSDCRRLHSATGWAPKRNVEAIVSEIFEWVHDNETDLRQLFG